MMRTISTAYTPHIRRASHSIGSGSFASDVLYILLHLLRVRAAVDKDLFDASIR